MQCKCCRNEVNYEQGVCPVCGFLLLGAGTVPEEIIAQHKKEMLEKITISVKTYQYDIEDSTVKNIQENWTVAGKASELEFDKILWLNANFEEIVSEETFFVTILLTKDGSKREQKFTFCPGKTFQRSAVGLLLKEGFQLCVTAGSKQEYLCSEQIPLLEA